MAEAVWLWETRHNRRDTATAPFVSVTLAVLRELPSETVETCFSFSRHSPGNSSHRRLRSTPISGG